MTLNKIGIISCSGEECAGGTISRLAVRKMMEEMRPGQVSTLCLPLFIAGDGGERSFAEKYPTIAVDGCSKCCAKRAIEKFSNKVAGSVDVEALIGAEAALDQTVSTRELNDQHRAAIEKTVEETCRLFDEIASKAL
ncbi:putative zinc-binding protein [Eubacteriaceae bacterium ES2]|nr:putative zinc-binding protein [Eubacteriaceae bacterium ES2]